MTVAPLWTSVLASEKEMVPGLVRLAFLNATRAAASSGDVAAASCGEPSVG